MKKQTIAFYIACCMAACLMTACSGNGVPYFADDDPIVPTNYYLRVSPTTLSFDYDDTSSRTIQVESNTSWSVKCDAEWVSVKTEKAGKACPADGSAASADRTAVIGQQPPGCPPRRQPDDGFDAAGSSAECE